MKKDTLKKISNTIEKNPPIETPSLSHGVLSQSEINELVEAILFLENTFVSIKTICKKLNISENSVKNSIEVLQKKYTTERGAVVLLKNEEEYMLVVKKELATQLYSIYKPKQYRRFSSAVLETLAIIAYSQPITRIEIQSLRGVNSDSTLKILLEQNVVRVIGTKNIIGNPNQYGTTPEFLRVFGLSSIKDLPKLRERDSKVFE